MSSPPIESKPPLSLARSPKGVATLTLTRGAERNLIDNEFIHSFRQHLGELARDKDMRCLILRGDGPAFSGGGRIQWLQSAEAISAEANLAEARALVALFSELNEFPAPVVAAVHGAAIGGAVALVCACDVVIATADTVFSLSEARLGLVPACAAPFVIAKIGASWARRLFVTGERFSASQALTIGLVHEVVPSHAQLDAAVARTVTNILDCAPQANRVTKRLVLDLSSPERRQSLEDMHEFVAGLLAAQRTTPEGQEGMDAFLAKRPPSWRPNS